MVTKFKIKHLLPLLLIILFGHHIFGQENKRHTINLNGEWLFEQSMDAFRPDKFTRKCPVPGLIHLARPKIDDYDVFFQKPERSVSAESHDLTELDYTPKYSWYKKSVYIPADLNGKNAEITILKSQYVTQVFVNGMDIGQSMACYTPIVFDITDAIKYGSENEILIRIGDRAWLPSPAAGGTDKEKVHYLPGIWDDVFLTFTGNLKLANTLVLPSLKNSTVTVKCRIRSFYSPQILYGDPMSDSCRISITLIDPENKKVIAEKMIEKEAVRDQYTIIEADIPVKNVRPWTPENPKLYTAEITLHTNEGISDEVWENFGMRDFERKGKYFYLNGEKMILRGTNITLHRFFEDPDLSDLVWDKKWVKKLLIDIPKETHWNAMRVCVGLVPDFWYDIADEYGLMIQNEWLYWQDHGWNEQIRKEYTDWVWADGSHPSIVIWDAMNENWNDYIGNELIPELRVLDPTRIWDAGYMTEAEMAEDDMDEIHPYRAGWGAMVAEDIEKYFEQNPYYLGDLDDWPERMRNFLDAGNAQLVNEYGWIWLWRNGQPAKLTRRIYDYLVGEDATPEQRRELMAYWLQLETEWLRTERSFAGILAFCYLTNNYGFTGDWFLNDISDLETGQTMAWFKHAFAPTAVFIDLPDQRYLNTLPPYDPEQFLTFNVVGINDLGASVDGDVRISIFDAKGNHTDLYKFKASVPAFGKRHYPVNIKLPEENGGYLVVCQFIRQGEKPVISRRYIEVGKEVSFNEYFEMDPEKK